MEQYMSVDDVCALSFHEKWDGREDYFQPGFSLPASQLRKWLGLGLIRSERFPTDTSYGYTWGIPVTEIPRIREFYLNPPNTKEFSKSSRVLTQFLTWREYMDKRNEFHV